MEQTEMPDGRVLTHHNGNVCFGQYCPLHNPSDHSLREYPLDWDAKAGVMVRVLPDGGTEIDPDEYRLHSPEKYLYRNAAKCKGCLEILESTYRHDFVSCSCGNLSVDGGHDYPRRVFGQYGFEDMNVYIGGE
jgi:hypothetical protein